MAEKPIATPLPADLPTDWAYGQTVAPAGSDAGLSKQHGYNYLMEQVNAAQMQNVASLGENGKLAQDEIPDIDGGVWSDV